MTNEDIDRALDACADLIWARSTPPYDRLAHAITMCAKAKAFTDLGEKNRWLGFIQGVIWSHNLATIDEMREINKPYES